MYVKRARYVDALPPKRKTARPGRLAVVSVPRALPYRKSRDGELKFLDTALSFTVDATGEVPATGQLNLIPQDATQSGRVGRKVVVKSVWIKASAQWTPGASTTTGGYVYLYLVVDRQANKAAAAATDVLTSTAFASALPNVDNEQRFRILRKWKLSFNPTSGVQTAYGTIARAFEVYAKCNVPLEFDNTASTGAITTITSNNIFLLAGSDGNTDDAVSVAGTARIRYSDS